MNTDCDRRMQIELREKIDLKKRNSELEAENAQQAAVIELQRLALQAVDDAFHVLTGRHEPNATGAMLDMQKHTAIKYVRSTLAVTCQQEGEA